MFCDEALNSVEAIAAGELAAEGRIAEHLSTCADCAAALESAKRLDLMLRGRAAPTAPPQFTARTLARVRRARWRSEQVVDAGFNAAVGLIAAGVVAAIWMLAHRTGMAVVTGDAVDLFARGLAAFAHRIGPSLPLYLGATALVGTALGIWWWAERDATL